MKPGWYHHVGVDGLLYVLEIRSGIKGGRQLVWLYQPIIRVSQRVEAPSQPHASGRDAT